MVSQPLKAIVVGGGPIGLAAAHALSRAGIDYVVLERRAEPIIDAGSDLVLNIQSMRGLSQLGLLEPLEKVSVELEKSIGRLDHYGRDIGDLNWFPLTYEHFGTCCRVLSRHNLTKTFYDCLSPEDKEKILTNKKVTGIVSTDEGVTVHCEDGTTYDGFFVIGADGAHSITRQRMRDLAVAAGSEEVNEEEPFLTTFRCLWMRFPISAAPELTAGVVMETHGTNAATQLFAGETHAVLGVYERLAEPTKERIRHSKADEEAVAARWAHLPITPGGRSTFGQMYEHRIQGGLVSLEEGVADHWNWGSRVVLIGDAAHKYTPSTGDGCNAGLVDIVVLTNKLHEIIQKARDESGDSDALPSREVIENAFVSYRDQRHASVVRACAISGRATSAASWGGWIAWFMDRFVMSSYRVQSYFTSKQALILEKTPVYTFIPGKEPITGKARWLNPIPSLL